MERTNRLNTGTLTGIEKPAISNGARSIAGPPGAPAEAASDVPMTMTKKGMYLVPDMEENAGSTMADGSQRG